MKKYTILSLTKDDLIQSVEGLDNEKALIKKIESFDDNKMRWIATKLGELYCETDYWNTLTALVVEE